MTAADGAEVTVLRLDTENSQTLTVVRDTVTGAVTLRIAKDGHNRGIAKLDAAAAGALTAFLGGE